MGGKGNKNDTPPLKENERAELAQKLLLSLDVPTTEEIEEGWLLEACHRAKELEEGIVHPFLLKKSEKAQTLLR